MQLRGPSPKVSPQTFTVFGVVATAFGVVFVALAVGSLVDTLHFAAAAERADGVVTNVKMYGRRGPFPVVRFQAGPKIVEIEGNTATNSRGNSIGEKVQVLYLAANPEAGRIDSFVERFTMPLAFGFIGTIAGGTGVFLM